LNATNLSQVGHIWIVTAGALSSITGWKIQRQFFQLLLLMLVFIKGECIFKS
jgi:hypothetical protein